MTTKRFKHIIDEQGGHLINIWLDGAKPTYSAEEVTEWLNTLHDENEQLKSDATTLIYHNREYRKKIESLKEENKFLQNKIATYKTANRLLKKTLDKEMK